MNLLQLFRLQSILLVVRLLLSILVGLLLKALLDDQTHSHDTLEVLLLIAADAD